MIFDVITYIICVEDQDSLLLPIMQCMLPKSKFSDLTKFVYFSMLEDYLYVTESNLMQLNCDRPNSFDYKQNKADIHMQN